MLNSAQPGIVSSGTKISPAFAPILDKSRPNDIRDAIVIFRTPEQETSAARNRLRRTRNQSKRAGNQFLAQRKILANYQRAGSKSFPHHQEPKVMIIGSNELPVVMVEITPRTLPILADQPDIVAILPNQNLDMIKPRAVEYLPLMRQEEKDGITWGLKQLGIPDIWKTTKGKGVKIGVLDTGVYGAHPALEGRISDFIMIDSLGRRIKTDLTFDCGQHGTHVCGTIAGGRTAKGVSIGIAPEAELFVAAVIVGDATLRTLMEGISWAVEKGVDIVNLSLGFSYYEPLFDEVFKILQDLFGILPVVAIGNENHGNTCSPGNSAHAFAVGAAEKLEHGKHDIAFFSSGASLLLENKDQISLVTKPDAVAPGVKIYSCIPPEKRPDGVFEFTYMNGTSMAAPHVAGIGALLMAANPDASVDRIIKVLKDTANHPKVGIRPDNRWGYGLVQPIEALRALGELAVL